MPNKNYKAGYRVENKLVNNLKKSGYDIAVRTAGSHSLFDVIGVHSRSATMAFFQCKKHKGLVEKEKSDELFDILYPLKNCYAYNVWPDRKADGGLHWEPIRLPLKTITW
jgi:hypothetical protein